MMPELQSKIGDDGFAVVYSSITTTLSNCAVDTCESSPTVPLKLSIQESVTSKYNVPSTQTKTFVPTILT
jgi:hypothetical protein